MAKMSYADKAKKVLRVAAVAGAAATAACATGMSTAGVISVSGNGRSAFVMEHVSPSSYTLVHYNRGVPLLLGYQGMNFIYRFNRPLMWGWSASFSRWCYMPCRTVACRTEETLAERNEARRRMLGRTSRTERELLEENAYLRGRLDERRVQEGGEPEYAPRRQRQPAAPQQTPRQEYQAQPEAAPERQPRTPGNEITIKLRYDGPISRNQYDDVAIEAINPIFIGMEMNGSPAFWMYDMRDNEKLVTRKFLPDGRALAVDTIDLRTYPSRMTQEGLINRILYDLRTSGIPVPDGGRVRYEKEHAYALPRRQ